MKNTNEFSTRSVKNILKSVTTKRVGKDSAISLGEELESKATIISAEAIAEANSNNRKTVRQKDIEKAANRVFK